MLQTDTYAISIGFECFALMNGLLDHSFALAAITDGALLCWDT